MKKTKILILSKDIDGGTGTYTRSLLSLDKYFDVYLTILNPPKYTKIEFKKTYKYSEKSPENYFFSFSNIIFFIREIAFVDKVIKTVNPDLIFSMDAHCNIIAQIFKLFYKIKTILTTHNNLDKTINRKSTKIFNFFLRKTITLLYNQADILIGVSKGVSKSLKRDFGIKKSIITIYHGIKLRNTYKKRRNTANNIISVCRLDKQKDVSTLVKAFALVHSKIPKSTLTIVGDGSEKAEILLLIKQLNLSRYVKILSWQSNVNTFLNRADLFVLSSHYEGFSYAILEAMNCGLPIISTNSPYGPEEIIGKNQYGILVPIGNISILAKEIISITKSKEKYRHYHKQSLVRIKDFPIEKMINTYRKLILRLLYDNPNYKSQVL